MVNDPFSDLLFFFVLVKNPRSEIKNPFLIEMGLSAQPFSQETLCTWPHFESEGFWNSEVAYYKGFSIIFQKFLDAFLSYFFQKNNS